MTRFSTELSAHRRKRGAPSAFAFALACGAAILTSACGGPAAVQETTPRLTIDTSNLGPSMRRLQTLPDHDPDRLPLRNALAEALGDCEGAERQGDYEALKTQFEALTQLLRPADFTSDTSAMPPELVACARRVVAAAEPRGDEALVLSGFRVLGEVESYAEVVEWGMRARRWDAEALRRYALLLELWGRHAELTPAGDVLAQLSEIYQARRDEVSRAYPGPQYEAARAELDQATALEVAAAYLRHGLIDDAANRVAEVGAASNRPLLEALAVAESSSPEAAESLFALAELFRSRRPDVSKGLCTAGIRRFPSDARFPTCLAQVAFIEVQASTASAWYERAIELSPNDEALMNEAASRLVALLEGANFEERIEEARFLGNVVQRIVRQRDAQFPGNRGVSEARVKMMLGMAEAAVGNLERARQLMEESAAEEPAPYVWQPLARVQAGLGDYDAAVRTLESAEDGASLPPLVASLLITRARYLDFAGNTAGAEAALRRALELLSSTLTGDVDFDAQVLATRGRAYAALGENEHAQEAFAHALELGSTEGGLYLTILQALVVHGGDATFAARVSRAGQMRVDWDSYEWRAYLGLWASIVARQTGSEVDSDTRRTLERVSRLGGWGAQLAAFGSGGIDGAELLARANTPGQRLEARYYALVLSDAPAETLRTLIEELPLVFYYEFEMAQAMSFARTN